jgi:hypothetical protein
MLGRDGASASVTRRDRRSAANWINVPTDEIATAIAAARGALLIALRLGKVSIAERSESCGAVRYDLSTHIFFDR